MDKPRELYHEELTNLEKFKSKIDTHAIYKKDLDDFSDQYEELVAQAKVITRVSDRLQKKLDTANVKIREQNEEISTKNTVLEDTVQQLAVAKVGRRAATVMLTVALLLFILEQVILQPIIDDYIASISKESMPDILEPILPYMNLFILGIIFFGVKYFESALEGYFMARQKKKIIGQEGQGMSKVQTKPSMG
jgi:hypothetical protein